MDPDQRIDKQRFLDRVFKIKREIERFDKSDVAYQDYMSGVDRFDIQMRQKKRGQTKTSKMPPKPTIKPQIITEPKEYVTLQEEQQQEEKDDGRDNYDKPPIPGTSSSKLGPAIYFSNDALKTFADYDKLVDIAARGYNSRDYYLSSGFESAIPRDKCVQSVYFTSKINLLMQEN